MGPLAHLDAAAGGKGRGLARLAAAGLLVPETVVVPVGCFRAHVARATGADPHQAVLGTPLDPALAEALVREARRLGGRIVVRSSGLDEDGSARSFAGIHETVVGVAPEEVPAAVRRVWASAFSPTARAYGSDRGLAVLVQPLVEAHAAGVVFTVDPATGSWREMVVEAVRGQGEALVSGRQAPQWAIVRRARHPAARRIGLRVLEEDVVPQPNTWDVAPDGELYARPTPPGAIGARLLAHDALLALCRSCLKAERAFGEPMDIEWAWDGQRFWFLQARPITRAGVERDRDILWTRRFLGERWPDPPTPLTWSILAPLLDHFIGYPHVSRQFLGGSPSLRRVGGHAYLNVTLFRHLLFKWPGSPAPRFILELLPPEEADRFRRSYRVRADWAVYRAIFATTIDERRWERFAPNPLTNPTVWDAFLVDLREELTDLAHPGMGAPGAMDRVNRHVELLRQYLGIHVCSLLFANLAYQLLHAALAAWIGGTPSAWMAGLATSAGNRTLELNQALGVLAGRLDDEDRAKLAAGTVSAEVRGFLETFGSRAEASWEIFSPRWRDHPERLVPLLGRGHAGPAPQNPTLADLGEAAAPLSRPRRILLRGLVRYTRRYLILREDQRFELDRLMAGLQRALLDLGEHLGIPAADVPLWHLEELEGRMRGTLHDDPPVAARRAARLAATRDPPVFLRGDTPADDVPGGNRLEGQGISGGRVRGRVRVLRTLADGQLLEDGEILVAAAVDPGWTPLLMRAGGIVLELGSLLSHGAVIAREYGVPGVVNLSGVTRTLRTGMEVTVDGSRGVIWIH